MSASLRLDALPELPLVQPGDDLAELLAVALKRGRLEPAEGDVLVVAQKIVSKSENRYCNLSDLVPSSRARELAGICGKDPRLVECILQQSVAVVRCVPGVLIVEHRLGFIHANAGIDQSNIADHGQLLLLPENPDHSARQLRTALAERIGVSLALIINDSSGRAWRNGIVGTAIGCAGLEPLQNCVETPDLFGRPLQVTEIGLADELSAAASLLMGQAAEGRPAVLVRGLGIVSPEHDRGIAPLLRSRASDLFR